MSSFTDRVYQVVLTIPVGRVVSYTQVAKMVDSPRAARAVGIALRKNTRPAYSMSKNTIPCHRVVHTDRTVGEYNGGRDKKRELLCSEGVVIYNNKIDPSYFWSE